MGLSTWACRQYQRLFRVNHPEGQRLADLDAGLDGEAYLRAYFDHEYQKGGPILDRFLAASRGWVGGRGLDFGCGGGGITYRLREHCTETVGIDVEPAKIEHARKQAARLGAGGVEFAHYDGGAVPLPDASFDVILCVDVIEHLPDPARFVGEFLRLLRPGGWLLMSFGPPWYHPHGKHMWVKLPGWWTHLLFPRAAVMATAGYPADLPWAGLQLHRLSVGHFERVMGRSGFEQVRRETLTNRLVKPLTAVPLVRELFIGEVWGVYRKPLGR